jgi:hypothetical protein
MLWAEEARAWRAPDPEDGGPQHLHRSVLRLFNDDQHSPYSQYAVAKVLPPPASLVAVLRVLHTLAVVE